MLPDARLDIVLTTRSGKVADVGVVSTRLVQASRLFAGRRPDEVLALLPTVFSLCGTAQALAGIAALEAAAGLVAAAPHRAARRMLLLAETVSEHGLGIARDWPALIGRAVDLDAARRIKTAMGAIRPALYPDGDWRHLGGGVLKPDRAAIAAALDAARKVLAEMLGDDPQVLADPRTFRAWLADPRGIAGSVLAGLDDFGAARFLPMPRQGPPDLGPRLEADDGTYVARPDCGGVVFETGPLARHHAHPLVAALLAEQGPGVLTRLVARLVEMVEALREMASLVQDLPKAVPDAAPLYDGTGLGMVEAARGQLAHRVEVREGRVIRYQILAPTEWNFHPDGPLARGLAGVEATADLDRRARLLVHALDPCVACDVMVR